MILISLSLEEQVNGQGSERYTSAVHQYMARAEAAAVSGMMAGDDGWARLASAPSPSISPGQRPP